MTPKIKTFEVAGRDGATLTARQLGTFAYYIKGVQFRFVVTELPGQLPALTHRISRMRVCDITLSELAACRHNVVDAAKLALHKLIQSKGEDRIHDVLRNAGKAKETA